jgi:hypothetical protein
MKRISVVALALAGAFINVISTRAIALDDIQLWSGSGTNRAAFVIEWSSPEVFNATTVPAPLADKTMVWGFRFNGTTNATAMLNAIIKADPRLYVIEDNTYGTYVVAFGYNLAGNGISGVTDGTNTDNASAFVNGICTNETTNPDAAFPINSSDLYWGGYYGPNWELWCEAGDAGGFQYSPNRGTNAYWTADDPSYYSGSHGQWLFAFGLDDLPLSDGSWIGFSVASGGDDYLHTNSVGTLAYEMHKHAPVSPEGVYFAYVPKTNDFAAQIINATNVDTSAPYNDPTAMLGRPTLTFIDYFGTGEADRTKIIEPPYWTAPNGSNVIAEILDGGEVTLKLGRKVFDDPNNPYGVDLIVFGNSFFSASGITDFVSDETDLNTATLGSGYYGHPVTVSVSQDGQTWFSFTNEAAPFPDNAYRWDEPNAFWTAEQMNPTKPLNPSITGSTLAGLSVAAGLDQFAGASGGTGYDLKASGLPWIQYVRLQPPPGSYAVIDAVAAVNPTVVGDAFVVTPANVQAGFTNLSFANPANSNEVSVLLGFSSINDLARVSAVKLSDLDPFAPVSGAVSSAWQISVKSENVANSVRLQANASLRAGVDYSGDGSDLRVWQWGTTNWHSLPFQYHPSNNSVALTGLTNLGAFVVSQYLRPQPSIVATTNGLAFQFTPQPNVAYSLQRAGALGPATSWASIVTVTPTNAETISLQDNSPPATQAFYRLKVSP